MLTLKNSPGLMRKLADAGLGIEVVFSDGHPPLVRSSDDAAAQAISDTYTVAEEQAYASAQIDAYSKTLRDKVTSSVSAGEMASWSTKSAEAKAYKNGKNPADAPLLAAEAAERGVSIDVVANRVAANAALFLGLESRISGVAGRHKDGIAACATLDQIAAYDYSTGWPVV